MPDSRALPTNNGSVSPPFTDEQIAKLKAYQGDPLRHQLTCEIHSNVPLVPTRNALRCDDPNCDYTQTWVPGMCLR